MNDGIAAPPAPLGTLGAPFVGGGAGGGGVVVVSCSPPPGCIHAGGCSPASARTTREPAIFRTPTLALPRGVRALRTPPLEEAPRLALAGTTEFTRPGAHAIASELIANAITHVHEEYSNTTLVALQIAIPNDAEKKATAGRTFVDTHALLEHGRCQQFVWTILTVENRPGLSLPRAGLVRRARARRYTVIKASRFLYPLHRTSAMCRHELLQDPGCQNRRK